MIHADDYGTLYRHELPSDEPIVMVSVLNKTAESDGSYKPYLIRVPSDITTAHAAVAWTFQRETTSYRPTVET